MTSEQQTQEDRCREWENYANPYAECIIYKNDACTKICNYAKRMIELEKISLQEM